MRFSEILVIATAFTGLVWLLDAIFLRPKRMLHVMPSNGRGQEPWWVEYAKAFFPILLIVLILRSFLAEPFRIPSGSMRPTLLEGDFIVVNKYAYGLRVPVLNKKMVKVGDPKRGDIVVFTHVENGESLDLIKRVVGLPNDRIEYKEKMLYVNGEPVKEEFLMDTTDKSANGEPYPVRELKEFLDSVTHRIYVATGDESSYRYDNVTVPEGSYFMMGDNRNNSKDSRMWGFVKDEDLQGRAIAIWMSWIWEKPYIRFNRLGKLE